MTPKQAQEAELPTPSDPINTFTVTGQGPPRTIEWASKFGPTQMMSEIGDGIFVGWIPGEVARSGLPIEPAYITSWRTAYQDAKNGTRRPEPRPAPTKEDNSDVGF